MADDKTGRAWIAAFAAELGVDPPDDSVVDALLELARVAAHASERLAAPIACYLVGQAGVSTTAALAAAGEV